MDHAKGLYTPQFIEVRLSGSGTPVIKHFSWQRGKPVDEFCFRVGNPSS